MPARPITLVTRALIALTAILALLSLPACSTLQDLVGLRDQAATERDRLDEHAASLETTLAATPPTDPTRPALEAELASTRTQRDLYDSDITRLDDIIAQAQSPTDPIAQAVGVVAPFLPIPARTPLVLGAALVGTLLRMHQLRQGLTSVARGFEVAKRDDPDFKSRFDANTPTFRSIQTPLARKLIARTVKG